MVCGSAISSFQIDPNTSLNARLKQDEKGVTDTLWSVRDLRVGDLTTLPKESWQSDPDHYVASNDNHQAIAETDSMKKFLLFALFAFAAWLMWPAPKADWKGIPAEVPPVQTKLDLPAAFVHGDYTITPLARYNLTAVVLGRERYRHDRDAVLSPVDLALGWGPMSMADVMNDLKISQSGRWYQYRWSDEPPLDPAQIAANSANTHCLPADKKVRSALLAVKRHDLVTLEGYLVEVTGPKGYRWSSSLTRNESGARACEVFWITRVVRKKL